MSFDELNNSPEIGVGEKRKIPLELSLEEKKDLYRKILTDLGDYNGPHPPERQDKYLELDTPEVMKRLRTLGLLEVVREFQKKKNNDLEQEDSLRKAHEFEIMARFTLMEVENPLR
ncbi:MAG: hypothetical protein WC447_02225 [Candidatus Paceibacterota bacterium]|jgi:hypothetical protein